MERWYAPPSLATWLLVPLALVYGLIIRAWHLAFDLGWRRAVRIEGAYVISVGNLVVGGSGKTPVVIHLARQALAQGHRVAVLSRGYGRRSAAVRSFTPSIRMKLVALCVSWHDPANVNSTCHPP